MARPLHISALIRALQFQNAQPDLLRRLSRGEWEQLLAYSDLARLTLILGQAWPEELPHWVQERIARNLADNTERVGLAQCTYRDAADALRAAGAEHLVMKGFAQWPYFISDLRLRQQTDLDLYCPAESLFRAHSALLSIGYEAERSPDAHDGQVADHLPTLIRRRHDYQWHGNAYDPDLSLAIDLHYQFWGRSYARFGPTELDAFWTRRCNRLMNGMSFQSLDPLDAFAFSAIHVLRHVLYGYLVPYSVYELAFFLHQNVDNQRLWKTWFAQHEPSLRVLTAVPSLLAAQWFGCRMPEAVADEIERLPAIVPRWLERFGDSMLISLFELNKNGLWLQLGLIGATRDRVSTLLRRLFPLWVPPLNSRWVQEPANDAGDGQGSHISRYGTYCKWFVQRSVRHLRLLPSTVWGGLRLWAS